MHSWQSIGTTLYTLLHYSLFTTIVDLNATSVVDTILRESITPIPSKNPIQDAEKMAWWFELTAMLFAITVVMGKMCRRKYMNTGGIFGILVGRVLTFHLDPAARVQEMPPGKLNSYYLN